MLFVVKFWEAFLKSKATKKRFIQLLINNLKKKWFSDIKYKNAYLLVKSDDKNAQEKLKNTFWIQKFEKILEYYFPQDYEYDELSDIQYDTLILNYIFEKIIENYNNYLLKWVTFRLTVKRENKQFSFDSMEISKILWKKIEEKYKNSKASYKNYELNINIRILRDSFWLWSNFDEFEWLWWLPYGIEWKALNLFSGWIDSPVATFLAAKRGIKQDFLFLNIPNSDFLLQQVFTIYEFLKNKYQIEWKFYELKVGSYIKKIKELVPEGKRQIVFKLFLYKLSEKFSDYLKLNVVVNWENLGQVSTQTLINMSFLDKSTSKFCLRPLVCYDKIEIINLAKKIWTYDLSIQIKETCSLERHSDSHIKNFEKIIDYYNQLGFNEIEILKNVKEIKSKPSYDFNSLLVSTIKWEIINLEKIDWMPKLSKDKEYTFVCSSGYKASQAAYEFAKKWFKTYFML